jgi:hypothetical protein
MKSVLKLMLIIAISCPLLGCDINHHHYVYIIPVEVVEDEETAHEAVWQEAKMAYIPNDTLYTEMAECYV